MRTKDGLFLTVPPNGTPLWLSVQTERLGKPAFAQWRTVLTSHEIESSVHQSRSHGGRHIQYRADLEITRAGLGVNTIGVCCRIAATTPCAVRASPTRHVLPRPFGRFGLEGAGPSQSRTSARD